MSKQQINGVAALYYTIFFFFFLLILGCDSKTEEPGPQSVEPIILKEDERYPIRIEFYGELVGPDSEPSKHMLIDYILIKDIKTGKVERFTPADAISLKDSFGYYTDVWSPDGHYIALPLGRFHGFALFSPDNIISDLQQKRYSQTIKIMSDESTGLWHEFIGWDKDHILRFSAGLSDIFVEFNFNPASGVVYTDTETAGSFIAITKNGIDKISKSIENQ